MLHRSTLVTRRVGIAFVVLALLLAATPAAALRADPLVDSCARDEANCCFPESKWPKPTMESRFRCEPDEDGSYPCSVRLAVSDWIGSFINVYVAKIFIEEFLGYPVEITADYSDYTGTVKESDTYASNGTIIEPSGMRRMSSGEIDVILEYWPSGHRDNIREFVVEKSTIKLAGENGIEGRIGWFLPSFVGEDNDPALDSWRTLTDPAKASLFPHPAATTPCCRSDMDQGVNAPCVPTEALGGTKVADGGMANATAECDVFADTAWHEIPTTGGRFLGGKPTWTTHDDQIIRNLGLPLTLVLAVSESKIMEEIETAHASRTPLLFYFWKPHGAFRMYDLDDFLLPLSSAECRSAQTSGDADCGYPIELLAKAYSVALEQSKPDVVHFVESVVFNSPVQQEEIHYELLVNSSRTLNEVACEWVKINEQTWTAWTESVEKQYEGEVWQDEVLEPTIMACDCKPDGLRDVMAVYDTSAYAEDGSVIIEVDLNPCSEARNVSLYKTRWSTMLLETEVLKEIQCAHVPLGSSGEVIILTLSSIAWLVLLICLVFVVAYRKHKAVKSARIRTLMILLFGAALMNGAETSQIGEPTRVKCAMRFSLLLFGFMYFVGSLLIKQFVIASVMKRTQKLSRRKQRGGQVFMRFEFTICTLVALALFGIWYAVVGFEPEAVIADVLLDVDELVCPTDSTLLMLIIAVCYLLIVVSCVLASQTRGLSGLVFNEGKFMLFSNYNVAVLTGLSLFVTLSPGMDASLKSLFVSFCILFSTVSCALLVVGSRVYAAGFNINATLLATGTATVPVTQHGSAVASSIAGTTVAK